MVPRTDIAGSHVVVYRRDANHVRRFCETLRGAGYDLACVESAEIALDAVRRGVPALLVVDATGGVSTELADFCRTARVNSDKRYLPILLLDESGTPQSHSSATEELSDDVLFGPPVASDVLLRVRSLVRLCRLAEETHQSHVTIRQQRDELARVNAQRGQLAALVVHDLKNPLAGIALNAKFLSRTPGLSNDAREAVDSISSAAYSMNRMVLNLLDIAKSDDGRLEPRRERCDICALARTACDAMRLRAASSNQALRVELPEVAVEGRVDQDLVRRVIENLVDNAMRFTPTGGAVTVTVRDADPHVEIRVIDEGPGIPDEYRQRIFEKYVQLDAPTDLRSRTGRGMGLLFCRLAAEAHGGRVYVESSGERGSVFCVELPRA